MKWPLVWRTALENAQADQKTANDSADRLTALIDAYKSEVSSLRMALDLRGNVQQQEITYLRERNEALTNQLLELKREGFEPPPPKPTWSNEDLIQKIPKEVLHRIEMHAEPGTKEHYEMLLEAETLLKLGVEDWSNDDIAERVTEGAAINPFHL